MKIGDKILVLIPGDTRRSGIIRGQSRDGKCWRVSLDRVGKGTGPLVCKVAFHKGFCFPESTTAAEVMGLD